MLSLSAIALLRQLVKWMRFCESEDVHRFASHTVVRVQQSPVG